jgi:hypothetical protein
MDALKDEKVIEWLAKLEPPAGYAFHYWDTEHDSDEENDNSPFPILRPVLFAVQRISDGKIWHFRQFKPDAIVT